MADDRFIYGAVKLEDVDIHFPPMGPNFDVRLLSIRCNRTETKKSLFGKKALPKDHVIVDIRLVIGPNKLRIPLHEEGNLDLKGEFQFKFRVMPDNGFRFLAMKMGKIKHRPGPKTTKYSAAIMRMAQKMSTLSGVLPEWNMTEEMRKAKDGVPLGLSSDTKGLGIFMSTPMEFLLDKRGLDPKNLHQYFKFAPMYDGTVLKFAFFVGPEGGNTEHIILEALPVEQFKGNELLKIYAEEHALNDFLATTVFDVQKPSWRAVSTQVQVQRQPNDKTTIEFYGFFRKAILFEDGDDVIPELQDQLAIKRLVDCYPDLNPFGIRRAPIPKSVHVDERGVETEREGDIPGISELIPDIEKKTNEVTRKAARRQLMEVWTDWLDHVLDSPFTEIDRDPLQRLAHKILRKAIKIDNIGWDGHSLRACLKLKNTGIADPKVMTTMSSLPSAHSQSSSAYHSSSSSSSSSPSSPSTSKTKSSKSAPTVKSVKK